MFSLFLLVVTKEITMTDEVLNEVQPENNEDLVPKKAYLEINQDMHKYKSKLKETEALLNQLKAEKEAAEMQSLKENEQWKTLYEKTSGQLEELNNKRAQERDQFINYHKKNAVIRELGGFKKDEYNSFINVSNIEMDEQGNFNQESLINEVNRLKQTYPELIKGSVAQNLPNEAAKSPSIASKSYSLMSEAERRDLKMKLLLENKK
jgi:hypothetical protein